MPQDFYVGNLEAPFYIKNEILCHPEKYYVQREQEEDLSKAENKHFK